LPTQELGRFRRWHEPPLTIHASAQIRATVDINRPRVSVKLTTMLFVEECFRSQQRISQCLSS
jgi:hypothetical protein